MKRVLKKMPKVLLIMLFVLMFAIAALVGTMVLSPATGSMAEASTASSISLSQLAGGNWSWSDHSTKVTIGQWKGSSFKRYTDNTLGVGYRYDSSSCVTTSGLEYTVPDGQTIESFSLSITTTAAVRIQYQVYKKSASSPWGYDYPDSGIAAQSGNTYSVTNSAIYHRNSYKATTLTGGDKITFAIYDSDVITHSGSTIYTGGKVARDGNIAVTALSITLNNAAYSVSINAGTGISDAFLSTSSVATSGSASGTKFDVNAYVYGFVKLKAGYKKPNSANWTLIDGTYNQENAIYRVAEQKVGSKNVDFGTINAEAKTKNLYKMDGAISRGYETLNWGQAKTIPAITKTGYNFINYNTAADGTGTTYGNSSGASLTATQVNAIIDSSISSFYAQWSAKTFEVTFNKEGGTGGDDGVTMTYDQPAPGPIAVPSKPGYTFQGYTATHPTNYSVITVYNSNGEATSSKWQIDSAVSPRATWYGKPYNAYITAGTGVKSVYLSSSYSATPGSSSAKQSGTSFTNGQYLCAYIVLERGYVAPAGWEKSGGDYDVGDGVFRKSVFVDIASDEEEDLKYDFGTVNAVLGNYPVTISTGTGVSQVKVSANNDGTSLVNSGSNFPYNSAVYAYATLSVGYKAQDGWTLISGEPATAGALYLVDNFEHIDINSSFGSKAASPKSYSVALEGLDEPIVATYDAPLQQLTSLPTLDGYTFVGYYSQPEGGNKYCDETGAPTSFTWTIDDDNAELYAHWTKDITYVVADYNGVYDGYEHTVSYEITDPASGYEILFGEAENDYYSYDAFLYTTAGTYTIYYRITADVGGVLYTTVHGQATVFIDKETVDYATAPAGVADLVYDNDDFELITAGTLADEAYGSVQYRVEAADGSVNTVYGASIPVGHNATTYTVYFRTTGSTNYHAIAEDSFVVVIAQVDKSELSALIDIVSDFYTSIVESYADIAATLDGHKQAISTDYIDDSNVTASQVADAVLELAGYLDTAKSDVSKTKIAAIGTVSYTSDSKALIDDAKDFFDHLDNDVQKDAVVNKSVLDAAYELYYGVDAVVIEINDIGEATDTQAFRDAVSAARTNYNDLSNDKKDIFPADVLKVLTDDEAIVPVMNEIDAIGTPEDTEDFRDKVAGAREAYDALTDDQKDIFPEDVLKVLTDDEAIVPVMDEIDAIGAPEDTEDFRSAVENARESYDGLSDDQKDTFPADVLKTLEDDEAVVDAMDIINAIAPVENDPECAERVQEARDAYDGLSDDQEAIVPEAIVKSLTDAEAAIDAIDKINAIGDLVFDESEERINEARETYDGLTPDQKALVPAETLKELEDKETAYQAMEKINAIGDVDLTDASKGLIDEAREAYDALTPDQKAFVNADDLQELIDAEKAYEAMKKIDAIGTVEYTPECKALIDEAKAYFDALSDEQKAAVDNKDVLFKAVDDYAKVEAGIQKVSAIQNIRYDETSKSAIYAAREAYDALSVDQKAFFPEETLKELVDNEEAIKALEMISSIGGVEYSEESKDLIERARESYDSLTAEQKALIHVDDVATLTDSEQSYEELHDNAKIIYTTLLVIVCILLIIGLLILAYLVCRILKEKKKDSDNVMSVAFLPILLGASHYVDDPFIALYVLAALTVIVYIIDVILALRFPHFIKDVKKFFSKKKDADEEEEPTLAPEDEDLPPVRANEEVSEDDREEEDEIVFATDKSGNLFRIRFIRSFMAKLIQSSDETKAFYKELKNEILSYKGVKDRLSWHYDSHNRGREQVVKFGIRGKTLCLYFALDMKDFKGSKYKVELCESNKYAAVPCMYRIKSAHRCEYAKDLIAMVAGKFGLVKGEQQTVEYSFPYESTEDLIAKGLIKELKTQWENAVEIGQKPVHPVSVREADRAMSDEVAATFIQDDVDSKVHEGKKGIINIDVIGKAFNDGDTVDIEALWEKKLIPLNVGYVKVLARGALDKKLNVDLQDYSIQAVKMIALKGGTVKKAR